MSCRHQAGHRSLARAVAWGSDQAEKSDPAGLLHTGAGHKVLQKVESRANQQGGAFPPAASPGPSPLHTLPASYRWTPTLHTDQHLRVVERGARYRQSKQRIDTKRHCSGERAPRKAASPNKAAHKGFKQSLWKVEKEAGWDPEKKVSGSGHGPQTAHPCLLADHPLPLR